MNKTIKLLSILADPLSDEDKIIISDLLNTLEISYVAVDWPDFQDYMNEEWFQHEAILDIEAKLGHYTYLIPINRLLK